jgi:hypothetical protein
MHFNWFRRYFISAGTTAKYREYLTDEFGYRL